jgi:nucleotide-binding universal stress UspA family protein
MNEILVCLDGSALAEKILPPAAGTASAIGVALTFLRVVNDTDELSAAENYMRNRAG